MKKVLSIVPYQFLPPKMGGQKGIALFNQFISRYISLSCIATQNNEPSYAQQYTVKNILSNRIVRYINPLLFFRIKKLIRQEKFTSLILEHPYYGWLGILLRKFAGIQLIVHSHNIEAVRFRSMNKWWWPVLWQYEKWTYHLADICFFITNEDREYAIDRFNLKPAKCHTITYGFDMMAPPTPAERDISRNTLRKIHNISNQEKIILFNGTLAYKPNLDALMNIIEKINPALYANESFRYRILICGKGLPDNLNNLEAFKEHHIEYAGFVDDITIYFKGADIFINPVIEGGGIKTKLVEALGFNLSVITTQSGATGIPLSISGEKMYVVSDTDWSSFAQKITTIDTSKKIPAAFFDHFYWDNIAQKAAGIINKLT